MKNNILDKNMLTYIYKFINKHGNNALITALENYENLHQVYIYRTQNCIKRIPICSINYIEIFGHDIVIHTITETLKKYGTLKKEYTLLKNLGFVRCNQSLLVPIHKIKEIRGRNLILETEEKFILSRSCATEVIYAYVKNNIELIPK